MKIGTCIGILGWGKSGRALTQLLIKLRKKVRVSESKEEVCFDKKELSSFLKEGVEFEFGGHRHKFLKDCDLIIASPSIKVSALKHKLGFSNMRIIGEIEFCSQLTQAQIIAITGTNGKTTTSHLLYRTLRKLLKKGLYNRRVFLGGNIGVPFSKFVLSTREEDIVILEVSSFQLETIEKFRPYIACVLNISADHLDYHGSLESYIQAKLNIFKNQILSDWAVINKEIEIKYPDLKSEFKKIKAKTVFFSPAKNKKFPAASAILKILGIKEDLYQDIFSHYKLLPHRLEIVGEKRGVIFINDSKSTTPASCGWALENVSSPIILIAGGRNKNLSFSEIIPFLKKVKKINLIGEAAGEIFKDLKNFNQISIFSTLQEAVYNAFSFSSPGDVVLFSPMCASFDMFFDYRERGNVFKNIVKDLVSA